MNQKLVAAEILAAPFAERRDQVRRLYFDLTGLPPSPQALKEMLTAADFESSYRKLVDDLLAAPHYGETFERRWMDVAAITIPAASRFGWQVVDSSREMLMVRRTSLDLEVSTVGYICMICMQRCFTNWDWITSD